MDYLSNIITAIVTAAGAWFVTHWKAKADLEAARLEAQSAAVTTAATQATALEQLKADVTEDVIRRLKDELDRVYTQKDRLERELADATSLIRKLRDERDELRDERDRLRDERDAQGDRITHLEGVVAALEQRISHISEPIEASHV